MQKTIDNNMRNRVAEDLNQWNTVESGLYQRHGRRVAYDRQFIRAKRDNLKSIQDKYKKSKLNPYEKAELRIMRSERRALLKRLYPNPYVRLLRNLAVLTFNIGKGVTNLLIRGAKLLFSDSPGRLVQEPKPVIGNNTTILHGNGTKLYIHKNRNASKTAAKQQQSAPVRKLPVRSRVQMAGSTRGRRI